MALCFVMLTPPVHVPNHYAGRSIIDTLKPKSFSISITYHLNMSTQASKSHSSKFNHIKPSEISVLFPPSRALSVKRGLIATLLVATFLQPQLPQLYPQTTNIDSHTATKHACHIQQVRAEEFNPKVKAGSASTTMSGTTKTITRGVDLQNADFSGQQLGGVSFQQSLLRDANFKGSKLKAASFFDADLTNANFEDADLSLCNLELANMRGANLRNAILANAYIASNTKLAGADIQGADFSDVLLRKDQIEGLCKIASGTNKFTGVDTRESLMCPD